MPLAKELARQLALPEVSVLALRVAPQSPPAALQQGVGTTRSRRATVREQCDPQVARGGGRTLAVISAHRSMAAPGGGELRLSLSSPFDPRQAEGFGVRYSDRPSGRCRVDADRLLRECRVADVRVLPGVHPDRDRRPA